MTARRPFLSFILLRFPAWAFVALVVAMLLGAIGVIVEVQMATLVLAAFIALVVSFFEYDSLPRKIEITNGCLSYEDASGEIASVQDFGLKRCLWLTRIVFSQTGSVRSIPLEAFVGTVQLTRDVRAVHHAEKNQRQNKTLDTNA